MLSKKLSMIQFIFCDCSSQFLTINPLINQPFPQSINQPTWRALSEISPGLTEGPPGLTEGPPGLTEDPPGLSEGFEGSRGDRGTDGRTDGRNFSPFYRTSSPLGAAAQKPTSRQKASYNP